MSLANGFLKCLKELNELLFFVFKQVFKFPAGKTQASLILGKRLKHGSDDESFCKPTDVAVLKSGEFFVAEG